MLLLLLLLLNFGTDVENSDLETVEAEAVKVTGMLRTHDRTINDIIIQGIAVCVCVWDVTRKGRKKEKGPWFGFGWSGEKIEGEKKAQ